MGTIRLGLLAWAVVGPLLAGAVAYTAMSAREKIITAGAVRIARGEEVVKCNDQRSEIGREINRASELGISEARAAAETVTETPEVPADLVKLCNASASCRDRKSP